MAYLAPDRPLALAAPRASRVGAFAVWLKRRIRQHLDAPLRPW